MADRALGASNERTIVFIPQSAVIRIPFLLTYLELFI